MDSTLLSEIPYTLDFLALKKKARVKDGSPFEEELLALGRQAEAIARPRACYLLGIIDSATEDQVVVEGVTLTSRVLRVNLANNHRVFPFVATCGMELQDWADQFDDMLYRFWAETIKELALNAAFDALHKELMERYHLDPISEMSPGSLIDWPIQQQTPLFSILGDMVPAIGVRLTDSLLMVPTKTISGILFPAQENFESCQLCPRQNCPGRRAVYDPALYDSKYRGASPV
jgi:hypothetical protein